MLYLLFIYFTCVQAAADNRLDCLRYLVSHLDDLEEVDFNGFTAIQLAEKYGNEEAIKILSEASREEKSVMNGDKIHGENATTSTEQKNGNS